MKNNNKKSKSQKRKKDLIPESKSRQAKVLIMPDEKSKVDIKTGNVSDLEMYKYLSDMAKFFAKRVCEDAEEVVGESEEDQIKYLDWRIKQSGING